MQIKQALIKHLRSTRLQPVWERCAHYSRILMNFGGGSNIESSGEEFALKYARSRIEDETPVIFDGGANRGEFTQLANDVFGEDCIVYAFEPSRQAFADLNNRVRSLNSNADLIPINLGLGERNESTDIRASQEGAKTASIYGNEGNWIETIQLTSVDQFCAENHIEIISYLKLDIEGHEFFALRGAERMMSSDSIRFIQFELGRSCLRSRVFFNDFFSLLAPNYRLFRVLPNGLREVSKYSTLHEAFETVNYLAEHRRSDV